MAVLRAFLKFEARQTAIIACIELPHLTQQVKLKKWAPNGHFNLQWAVVLDWMGSIAL
jgi:hypothetical protein